MTVPALRRSDPLAARPGAADPPRADIPFTDADFARIAAFAHAAFGLSLPPGKKDLVYSRLIRRLRRIGCPDFASYCALLERGDEEQAALVSALTTNVTHFFREEHHFRLLRDGILHPRADDWRQGRRLRLWSAGCSAGQEPYSLAMTVLEALPDAPRLNLRILATDVDRTILARAEAGSYDAEELRGLPADHRRRYFEPAADRPGALRAGPALRGLIRFAELNLMAPWPLRGPFDAIFCRNVAIYFDRPTQARLWSRLAGLLRPGGLLCIGHSERLEGPARALVEPAGITAYRRLDTPLPPDLAPDERTDA